MLRRWGILLGMLTLLAGVAVATTGRIGLSRPERARRHPPPGGEHELVRIRRHHRHLHQRLGELDRTDRHLQRERQVLLLLGGAGRLQQQLGRADRQRGRLLGEQRAVLRLVRDVSQPLALVLQHGAAG